MRPHPVRISRIVHARKPYCPVRRRFPIDFLSGPDGRQNRPIDRRWSTRWYSAPACWKIFKDCRDAGFLEQGDGGNRRNKNRVLAPASHMSRYSLWNKPRSWEQRAFHEKAFSFKDMARWDAKWHTLSPQARLAYLKDVKGPQQAQGPNQKRPSVKADRFAASVLEELLAAGFVELGDSGSAGPRDRVFAVVAASDFATRVRALPSSPVAGRPSQLARKLCSLLLLSACGGGRIEQCAPACRPPGEPEPR